MRTLFSMFLVMMTACGEGGDDTIDPSQLDPDDVDSWPAPSNCEPVPMDICPTGTERWDEWRGDLSLIEYRKPGEDGPPGTQLAQSLCLSELPPADSGGAVNGLALGYAVGYDEQGEPNAYVLRRTDGSQVAIGCQDGEQVGERSCFGPDLVGGPC